MNYSELNKLAIDKQKLNENLGLWVYQQNKWFLCDGDYLGPDYLHVASDKAPNWNPDLLTLAEAKDMARTFPEFAIWQIDEHDTFWRMPATTALSKNAVCLVQRYEPIYHPLQQKIAKLILKPAEPTKQEPAKIPRAHAELIKQWADDSSLNAFAWTDNGWIFSPIPTWSHGSIYAVAKEKPTSRPTQKFKITIDADTQFFEMPVGLDEDTFEEEVLKRVRLMTKHKCTKA